MKAITGTVRKLLRRQAAVALPTPVYEDNR